MKIIKHGTNYRQRKKFVCDKCKCKFVADFSEWMEDRKYNQENGVIKCVKYDSSICPECSNLVSIERERIEIPDEAGISVLT